MKRQLTNQQVFDRVWHWFVLKKKPQSAFIDDYGRRSCFYRTVQNGKVYKCAIGIFIPARDYCPEMEGGIARLLAQHDSVREALGGADMSMLESFQRAHDDWYADMDIPFWKWMQRELCLIANQYNLKYDTSVGLKLQ